MPSFVRRTLASATIAPLLALTLVACGDETADDADQKSTTSSSGSPTTSTDPSNGTGPGGSDPESNAEGAEVELPTGDIDPDEFVAIVEQGRDSLTTASVDLIADFDDDGGTGSGSLDLTGDRDALELMLTEDGIDDAHFILIDKLVYTKEVDEPKYVKIEPGTGGIDSASFFSFLHPFHLTGMVLDGLTGVEHIGEEEVDGVATTRYRVSATNEALNDIFGGLLNEMDKPEEVTEDLWLDAQGRLVKLVLNVRDAKADNSLTMTLGDFGEAPTVVEPRPDEVDELDTGLGRNAPPPSASATSAPPVE